MKLFSTVCCEQSVHIETGESIIEVESADHGFMCEQRASFNADASELGWGLLLEKLNA